MVIVSLRNAVFIFGLLVFCACSQAESLTGPVESLPNHAVVLLYHQVNNDTPAVTSVTPDQFAQQLQYLEEHNYQVWPLRNIIDHLQSRKKIPDKVVAITFDDGYRSIYENAYPLLKKHHWPFSIFISTEPIEKHYRSHLRWQELNTMAANGATIENHTVSHLHMPRRLPGQAEGDWQKMLHNEISRATKLIKKNIGKDPTLFAYPYGEYNDTVKHIVKEQGLIGIGQQSGALGEHSDWLALPRFAIAGDYAAINEFAVKLRTLPLNPVVINEIDNPIEHSNDKPELTLQMPAAMDPRNLQCFGSGQGKLEVVVDDNQVVIKPNSSIPVGRSRYNCTLSAGNNRFYWYSKMWLRLKADGSWVKE